MPWDPQVKPMFCWISSLKVAQCLLLDRRCCIFYLQAQKKNLRYKTSPKSLQHHSTSSYRTHPCMWSRGDWSQCQESFVVLLQLHPIKENYSKSSSRPSCASISGNNKIHSRWWTQRGTRSNQYSFSERRLQKCFMDTICSKKRSMWHIHRVHWRFPL